MEFKFQKHGENYEKQTSRKNRVVRHGHDRGVGWRIHHRPDMVAS
jgi:hypothetical protein